MRGTASREKKGVHKLPQNHQGRAGEDSLYLLPSTVPRWPYGDIPVPRAVWIPHEPSTHESSVSDPWAAAGSTRPGQRPLSSVLCLTPSTQKKPKPWPPGHEEDQRLSAPLLLSQEGNGLSLIQTFSPPPHFVFLGRVR